MVWAYLPIESALSHFIACGGSSRSRKPPSGPKALQEQTGRGRSVEGAGEGLAEGGKVCRPSGSQVYKEEKCFRIFLLPTLLQWPDNSKAVGRGPMALPPYSGLPFKGGRWYPSFFLIPPFCNRNPQENIGPRA